MGKRVVDVRGAAEGRIEINTTAVTNKIPNPAIKFIVKRIQRLVADSGYGNVTVTIKEAPDLDVTGYDGREAVGVMIKQKNSRPDLKGPVIEIRSLNGNRFVGEYTLAVTRTGLLVQAPAPRDMARQMRGGRNPQGALASGPNSRNTWGQQGLVPIRTDTAFDGSVRSDAGFAPGRTNTGFGAPGTDMGYAPTRTGSDRFYSSAQVAAPRPVPVQRIPASKATRRAPVPVNAFTPGAQGAYNQSRGPQGQYPRQQPQGPGRNTSHVKSGGGCCSGGGGDDDDGGPPAQMYGQVGGSRADQKKFRKERERREKEQRKREAEMMKKRNKKGKAGGYGGPSGMYAEKSGFYPEKESKSWCCC